MDYRTMTTEQLIAVHNQGTITERIRIMMVLLQRAERGDTEARAFIRNG